MIKYFGWIRSLSNAQNTPLWSDCGMIDKLLSFKFQISTFAFCLALHVHNIRKSLHVFTTLLRPAKGRRANILTTFVQQIYQKCTSISFKNHHNIYTEFFQTWNCPHPGPCCWRGNSTLVLKQTYVIYCCTENAVLSDIVYLIIDFLKNNYIQFNHAMIPKSKHCVIILFQNSDKW